MSLINDALRQARQTQPAHSATADGPALTPVEPARHSGGSSLVLPMIIAVVLAMAVALLWIYFRSGGDVLMVRASSHTQDTVEVATPQTPAPSPVLVPATSPVPPVNAVATNTTSVDGAASEPTAIVPTVAEPPKALPQVYRLQSIFFRAKNPSAVINGKTLFLGSRVGDAHIVAIDEESATIVNAAGQTNVLLLSD